MRHEGYDASEVATFLQAVADEVRAMQIQLELLRNNSADPLSRPATRAAPSPIVGIDQVASRFPNAGDPLESELTLDALQDAQADLVARVTSTARDLHESLGSGGPVVSPDHLRTSAATGASYSAPRPPMSPRPAPPAAPPASTWVAPPAPPSSAVTDIDLDADHLQEASNALDGVLDDVMGSIRPDR